MQPKITRRMQGISLLEVLLSLSIIAIILVMATRYFFVASQNDKVNTTISQVGGLIAAAHNWKGANPKYTDISISTLKSAGQLTNFPGLNNSNLSTMWGANIEVKEADTGSNDFSRASITFAMPDDASCSAVKRAFSSDQNANIYSDCTNKRFTYTFP